MSMAGSCSLSCSVRWEQETGQRIDLILQAGDLALFPIALPWIKRHDAAPASIRTSDTLVGSLTIAISGLVVCNVGLLFRSQRRRLKTDKSERSAFEV